MNDLLNEYPPILNINEVAEILGVAPNTIRKLIKNDSIPAVKVGKRYKITKTKLLNYLGEYNEAQKPLTRKS